MYQCSHFALEELFSPDMMSLSPATLWGMWNERILRAADLIRDKHGRIQVNTWKLSNTPTKFFWRGYRTPDCSEGAKFSRHRFCGALDLSPLDATAEQIRAWLRTQPVELRGLIARVEEGLDEKTGKERSWVHIDDGNTGRLDYIYFFKP